MGKDVIVACDMPDRESVMAFLERFGDERPFVKIGMELFYSAGPDIVREIKARGHKIFLDLKLCDIPNTVRGAMRSLRPLKVDIINLHAFGTGDMMRAAIEGLTDENGERHTKLIAVTVLTSTSEETLHREMLDRQAPGRDLHSLREERARVRPGRRGLLAAREPGHT